MEIRLLVGKNLRKYREAAGFSQEALAFECGLHRTYVSGVERGVRNPTVLVLEKLAAPLGITPALLLEDAAPPRHPKGPKVSKYGYLAPLALTSDR